jgi:hypothetical protein
MWLTSATDVALTTTPSFWAVDLSIQRRRQSVRRGRTGVTVERLCAAASMSLSRQEAFQQVRVEAIAIRNQD